MPKGTPGDRGRRTSMPRWTRDPAWIPERYRQNAVNRRAYREPSPLESAIQTMRMSLNRKIPNATAMTMLQTIADDNDADIPVWHYCIEAKNLLDLHASTEISREELLTEAGKLETWAHHQKDD